MISITVIATAKPAGVVSGFDQSMSNDGQQKTMIEFDLLGYSKLSAGAGNTYQIVPSTINGMYGTIPVS